MKILQNKAIDIYSPFSNEVQSFQIKYSNKFCKLTINDLIKDFEIEINALNKEIRGSGAGINFEKNVIDSILHNTEQVFGQLKYQKRIIFSLVGKT